MTDSNLTPKQEKKDQKSPALTVALVVVWIVAGVLLLTPKGEKNEWPGNTTQGIPGTIPKTITTPPKGINPYVTPGDRGPEVSPGRSNPLPTTNGQQQQQEEKRSAEEAQKQRDQHIYFTKLEIDRHQKAIQQCKSNIVNIDAQLANPYLASTERQKLQDLRDFRQRTMDTGKAMLASAQQKLQQLQGPQPE